MRTLARSAVLAALLVAPAGAMAGPFSHPALSEENARMVAYYHGITHVTDIDDTMGGDWKVKGTDDYGHEIKLRIDGRTGEIEHAEMNND